MFYFLIGDFPVAVKNNFLHIHQNLLPSQLLFCIRLIMFYKCLSQISGNRNWKNKIISRNKFIKRSIRTSNYVCCYLSFHSCFPISACSPYFLKNKSNLMRSPSCLCVHVRACTNSLTVYFLQRQGRNWAMRGPLS